MSDKPLRAPFPYFGGKSRAASLIWSRLGNPANFVEPFAGSLAVLLARPHEPGTETVNDLDCYVANFWRAVAHAPDEVARWCDWPVNEADLHARHRWLIEVMPWHRERIMTDPDYFDAKIAGWWVWGQSTAILGNWLEISGKNARPGLGPPQGIHATTRDIYAHMTSLCKRLRSVRVICGDWTRAMATWERLGITGIVLDPPYLHSTGRHEKCYREDSADIAKTVREWAVTHGHCENLRIVLCGYDDEHQMPADWECIPWKAGGMDRIGSGQGAENATRERLWFSPHCLKPNRHDDLPLFKETT